MGERVRITDVSPRDGLQNEPGFVPTADKVRLIELLDGTGVDEIEITSFVSPKWVPQLADSAPLVGALAQGFVRRLPNDYLAVFSVLVPNAKGVELLRQADRDSIPSDITDIERRFGAWVGVTWPRINRFAAITAASETFSRRNTNATIAESLERIREVRRAVGEPFHVRAYVSCAIACPFEGPIAPHAVADLAARLVEIGINEIDLGDTIGAADADSTEALLKAVRARIGEGWFERGAITLHLHDTFGRAADCVRTALDLGVRSFDGSVAGLGGCPYASLPGKPAPGNIDTQLLVRTIHGAGLQTGVDLDALARAAQFARAMVSASRAAATGRNGDRT